MLILPSLDFSEHKDLDYRISEFVNDVLSEIIQVAIELHVDQKAFLGDTRTSLLESVSPSVMMRESPKRCEDVLFELRELIKSPAPRFEIKPRYRYFLFQCIDLFCELLEEEESLIRTVPEPLRTEILDVYGEVTVSCMEDISGYLEYCFDDWDFLPENLSEMVGLYLNNSPYAKAMISVDELDEFIEIMDIDQREAYLQWREKESAVENSTPLDEYEANLFYNVTKALLLIQQNSYYYGAEENELNDALKGRLGMVYEVCDQTRQGVSETGNSSGEIDLLICRASFPFAIIEALKLESVNKTSLQRHINKLLVNYNPNGLPYAYLVVYYTEKNFSSFCASFDEYLHQYSYPYPVIYDLTVLDSDYSELFQAVITLNRNGKPMRLYFIAIHIPNK